MGQGHSDQHPTKQSKERLSHELVTQSTMPKLSLMEATDFFQAHRFKDKCFTSLEFYSLKDVFSKLADQQGSIHYLKEDTIARFLEIPDVLGVAPVVFQLLSYLGAFPFLHDAPAVLELPQLILVVVIMTQRYRTVLAKGNSDRTKLFFNGLAVYDRLINDPDPLASHAPNTESDQRRVSTMTGFAVDEVGDDADDQEDPDDDDLVLTAFELLDIDDAFKRGDTRPCRQSAMVPVDNFRKLIMLLLLAAPLDAQESLSQYSSRVSGDELDSLRSTADCVLAAFVDVETSPGIKFNRFKTVIPTLFPNLWKGFDGLFEYFLFSKDLDLSKKQQPQEKQDAEPNQLPIMAQPLLTEEADIMNEHILSQISFFLPGSDLFRRVRLLYSGNEAGFSIGSFETKVFNWRAPTILLVQGTRLPDKPQDGQEAAFADRLPPKRFPNGSKSDTLTFGVYVREPWKHTHKSCFGDSSTLLFQLHPTHDVFLASTINTDYITFTKPPSNDPNLTFGAPHPLPSKARPGRSSSARGTQLPLGPVSLSLDDSFEFAVFNHDFLSRGGAFAPSTHRRYNFQDRFRVDALEVWGCGGDEEAKAQAQRWAWEAREAEARRRVNLGTGDVQADRALLEMAGLIGHNQSGGSMG